VYGIKVLNSDRYVLEKKAWLSSETDAILWPISDKKVMDDSFKGPSVSAAIG